MNFQQYTALGLDVPFGTRPGEVFMSQAVNGRSSMDMVNHLTTSQDVHYNLCPEALPAADVPRGEIHTIENWTDSQIFPETCRSYSVYQPPGLKPGLAPSLLLCFDGAAYLDPEGPVRAAAVLDTLIRRGDIPPTVGVFINPGLPLALQGVSQEAFSPEQMNAFTLQRSFEYDSVDDLNARFVIDELLPLVEKDIGMQLSSDPQQRTACGISSGGIAAFSLAWFRPENFGRVISHCGSYVNLRGGHNYPYLLRITERKPIKIFLQSGEQDANLPFGSWPLANQLMADACDYAGYTYRFEFGKAGHNLCHAGALFAEALRWCEQA